LSLPENKKMFLVFQVKKFLPHVALKKSFEINSEDTILLQLGNKVDVEENKNKLIESIQKNSTLSENKVMTSLHNLQVATNSFAENQIAPPLVSRMQGSIVSTSQLLAQSKLLEELNSTKIKIVTPFIHLDELIIRLFGPLDIEILIEETCGDIIKPSKDTEKLLIKNCKRNNINFSCLINEGNLVVFDKRHCFTLKKCDWLLFEPQADESFIMDYCFCKFNVDLKIQGRKISILKGKATAKQACSKIIADFNQKYDKKWYRPSVTNKSFTKALEDFYEEYHKFKKELSVNLFKGSLISDLPTPHYQTVENKNIFTGEFRDRRVKFDFNLILENPMIPKKIGSSKINHKSPKEDDVLNGKVLEALKIKTISEDRPTNRPGIELSKKSANQTEEGEEEKKKKGTKKKGKKRNKLSDFSISDPSVPNLFHSIKRNSVLDSVSMISKDAGKVLKPLQKIKTVLTKWRGFKNIFEEESLKTYIDYKKSNPHTYTEVSKYLYYFNLRIFLSLFSGLGLLKIYSSMSLASLFSNSRPLKLSLINKYNRNFIKKSMLET